MKNAKTTEMKKVNPADLAKALKVQSSVRAGYLVKGPGGGEDCPGCGINSGTKL